MAVSFLTVDRQTIARRLEAAFDAAVDGQGRMLFPDHRIPGSPGYNLRRLMEQEVLRWHQEANAALSAMSPLTASGAFLDAWAAFFGMERGRARVARGRVRLVSQMAGADMERLLGSRMLPIGTRLSSGSVELELEEDAVFSDEGREVVVSVRARRAGSGMDLPEGVTLELVNSALRGFVRAEVVDAQHPRHAQVQHQLQPTVERADQELPAPADREHAPAGEPVEREEALLHVVPDRDDPAAGQLRRELSPDGLDLGKLWHALSLPVSADAGTVATAVASSRSSPRARPA